MWESICWGVHLREEGNVESFKSSLRFRLYVFRYTKNVETKIYRIAQDLELVDSTAMVRGHGRAEAHRRLPADSLNCQVWTHRGGLPKIPPLPNIKNKIQNKNLKPKLPTTKKHFKKLNNKTTQKIYIHLKKGY